MRIIVCNDKGNKNNSCFVSHVIKHGLIFPFTFFFLIFLLFYINRRYHLSNFPPLMILLFSHFLVPFISALLSSFIFQLSLSRFSIAFSRQPAARGQKVMCLLYAWSQGIIHCISLFFLLNLFMLNRFAFAFIDFVDSFINHSRFS